MFFEFLATVCAGLFAGAAVYVSLVEHPARLECGTQLAVTQFGPSYRRGAVMQASLAAIGLGTGIGGWAANRSTAVLIGSVALGLAIPYTLLVILPTNKRLLDPSLDRSSGEAAALLARWGRLHAARSVLGAIAFGVLAWHLMAPR